MGTKTTTVILPKAFTDTFTAFIGNFWILKYPMPWEKKICLQNTDSCFKAKTALVLIIFEAGLVKYLECSKA